MFASEMKELSYIFAAILRKDESEYRCPDYLSQDPPVQEFPKDNMSHFTTGGINDFLREQIADWSYKVVDFYNMDRETVSISLSIFDRYLSTQTVDNKTAQLVGMTCLYLSIKLHEQQWKSKMPSILSSFIKFGRGHFTKDHIFVMEEMILRALKYRVHPPTPQCIVHHLVQLFPSEYVACAVKADITKHAIYLTELSVLDYFFVTRKSSSIALAALLIAMEEETEHRLSPNSKLLFLENVRQVTYLDVSSQEVEECRVQLRSFHNDQDIYYPEADAVRNEIVSPVSVSGFVDAATPYQQHESNDIKCFFS